MFGIDSLNSLPDYAMLGGGLSGAGCISSYGAFYLQEIVS